MVLDYVSRLALVLEIVAHPQLLLHCSIIWRFLSFMSGKKSRFTVVSSEPKKEQSESPKTKHAMNYCVSFT